jgi:peptidoglycan/xylan/chitin deacetylase (PgdA/CDA1 family)
MLQKLFIFLLSVIALFCYAVELNARTDLVGLCYHQIEPVASGRYSLSSNNFRKHLEYLRSRNFQSLDSKELEDFFEGRLNQTGSNTVIITFDDGFKTVYDFAFPIMKEFGFKGIVCVYPDFIGAKNAMTWGQLKELLKEGWSVESHSMSHSNLAKTKETADTNSTFFHKEILLSKQLIEERLGNKVRFMVWPYGCYTTKTVEFAKKAGYTGAITVDRGANYPNLSSWYVKRQVIHSNDDFNKFLLRLGMRALPLIDMFPSPGEVIPVLSVFKAKLADIKNFSHENYVLNVKVTGRKTACTIDPATGIVSGSISTALKPGHYYIDFYLRNKATGITQQNGWLFSITGKEQRTYSGPNNY